MGGQARPGGRVLGGRGASGRAVQGGGQPLQEAVPPPRPEARGSWNRWPLGPWDPLWSGLQLWLCSSWGSRGLSQEMVEEVLTSFRWS